MEATANAAESMIFSKDKTVQPESLSNLEATQEI